MKRYFILVACVFVMLQTVACGSPQEMPAENSHEEEESIKEPISSTETVEDKNEENNAVQIKYCVGDVAKSDNYQITFIDAWTQESSNSVIGGKDIPQSGYQIVYFALEIENTSNQNQYINFCNNYKPKSDFHFYADDYMQEYWYGMLPENGYNCIFDVDPDITIPAGRKVKGYVDFTAPVDANILEMEFNGMSFLFEVKQ